MEEARPSAGCGAGEAVPVDAGLSAAMAGGAASEMGAVVASSSPPSSPICALLPIQDAGSGCSGGGSATIPAGGSVGGACLCLSTLQLTPSHSGAPLPRAQSEGEAPPPSPLGAPQSMDGSAVRWAAAAAAAAAAAVPAGRWLS